MFFSFDGIDGVGKSTQLNLFVEWLEDQGQSVTVCRDPGSTPLGEAVRNIVLNSGDETPIDGRSEMLLYMAARAQLVEQVIRPALDAGQTVVSDRFLLANIVYQGHAGGLDVESIRQVGSVATGGVMPDCVFLLDMDPSTATERLGPDLDRMERRGDAYRQKLRQGFLQEASQPNSGIHVINAVGSIEEVQARIREAANSTNC